MTGRLALEDLLQLPYAFDPQLSVDGVAYVVRTSHPATDENHTRIWRVGLAGGESTPLTAGTRDHSPRWSPDGRALAFVSMATPGSVAQVWTVPADGGDPRQVTSLPHGTASAPVWSPDGRWIAVLGVVPADDAVDTPARPYVYDELPFKVDGLGYAVPDLAVELFVVPASGGEARQLTHRGQVAMAPAWSPDGTRLAFTSTLDVSRLESPVAAPFVVPVNGGGPYQLDDDGLFHSFVTWMPRHDGLVTVATDLSTMSQPALYRFDLEGGHAQPLAPDLDRAVRIQRGLRPGPAAPTFSPDGQRLLFVACDQSRDHVFELAIEDGEIRKLVGGPSRSVSGLSVSSAGIAFVSVTPETTGEVSVAAVDGSGERTLTSLFRSTFGDREPFAPEERTFIAPDGQELHGWLIRGSGDGPRPLLVDVHGGPYDSWGPGFDGAELYEHVLAADGWNVLRLNARGSDGYGAAFRRALTDGWGVADATDFDAAIDALVGEGIADPQRLAIGGYSYGGFVACWLSAHSDRFAVAVTGGTVVNLVSICGTSDFGAHVARFGFGADPYYAHLDTLMARSPISYVDQVNAPTLILQGEADVSCSVEQAEQWFAALRAQGKPARLVVYPDAQHGFVDTGRPSHRLHFNQQIVQWIQEHIDEPRTPGTYRTAASRSCAREPANSLRRGGPGGL